MIHEDEEILMNDKSSFEDQIILRSFERDRTLYLYGDILEKTELVFNHMIERLTMKSNNPIHIKISSSGGDAFAGFSILSSIETAVNNNVPVHTYGYGKVMSAAVLPLIAGTYRACQAYTRIMIHNPMMGMFGYVSAEEMRRHSKDIDELLGIYKKIILEKTNFPEDKLNEIFREDKEFSLFGYEAKEFGFVDELI